MGARDRQVGGSHYDGKIQPWDIIDEWQLDYYEGNALKYLLRDKKDRLEDLEKAKHYIEKKIEMVKAEMLEGFAASPEADGECCGRCG